MFGEDINTAQTQAQAYSGQPFSNQSASQGVARAPSVMEGAINDSMVIGQSVTEAAGRLEVLANRLFGHMPESAQAEKPMPEAFGHVHQLGQVHSQSQRQVERLFSAISRLETL